MSQPINLGQLLALLLAQLAPLAPYLVSGATLSHVIEQWKIIYNPKTPNFVKIAIAFAVATVATIGANILTKGYAGGADFGVYASSTIQQAGLLFGTMTITNVSLDKFIPSLADWGATTITRFIVAIRKGVDTLINRGGVTITQNIKGGTTEAAG